jgi:WS/DGAT/MGAT family acyltransferase
LARCSLADVKEVRQVFGTTVNDVVLSATAISLRRYLLAHGTEPRVPLVASVPTAPARTDGDPAFGNRTSNMMVPLPVQLAEPGEVLHTIQRATKGAKATRQALPPDVVNDWVSLFPAALLTGGARVYSDLRLGALHPPLFNTIVSNMAGPPIPLYLAGARVSGIYPLGPLLANTGLNVTVLSRTGELDVGVIACPDLIPDVAAVTEGFTAAVEEMLLAAREPGAGD